MARIKTSTISDISEETIRRFSYEVISLFDTFPFNPNYIDERVNSLAHDLNKYFDAFITHCSGLYASPDFIGLTMQGYGCINKYCDTKINDDDTTRPYSCMVRFFGESRSLANDPLFALNRFSSNFKDTGKEQVNAVCRCCIPYILSAGKIIEEAPLIINVLPDLAEFIFGEEKHGKRQHETTSK